MQSRHGFSRQGEPSTGDIARRDSAPAKRDRHRPKSRRLWAVRSALDQQPVGFFYAATVIELVQMVDSTRPVHPAWCEYWEIDAKTALLWEDATSWAMGRRELHDNWPVKDRLPGARLKDWGGTGIAGMQHLVYGWKDMTGWRRFTAAQLEYTVAGLLGPVNAGSIAPD